MMHRWSLGGIGSHSLPTLERFEIAFWGRSNVGKSSLINHFTLQKNLARPSNTPGRTRQLFFFYHDIESFGLVDLPGYGYSQAGQKEIAEWQEFTLNYLSNRKNLRLLCLLIDARHGIKPIDMDAIELLKNLGLSCQVILTKTDKIPDSAVKRVLFKTEDLIAEEGNCLPKVIAYTKYHNSGREELGKVINMMLR